MTLVIMQPYLFPYLGYFQLISVADTFVIYDDVAWIKGGWINRNRILLNGEPTYVTLPVRKRPRFVDINEREFADDIGVHKRKFVRKIENAYGKAPYFEAVFPLVRRCMDYETGNVSEFVVNSLEQCCDFLGLKTPFLRSSGLRMNRNLYGVARVLKINKMLKATEYVNAGGGTELYDRGTFWKHGVSLKFLRMNAVRYRQCNSDEFVPCMSILDVMMFNSVEYIQKLLSEYSLE